MKIKVINLPNGNKRIVSGDLLEQFDLDYTQNLGDLKRDVQFALSVFQRTQPLEKNIRVVQDQHHLEVVDDNGGLGWLMVEDGWYGLLNTLSQLTDEDKKDLDEILSVKQSDTTAELRHA